jgi:hypothetical protein
LLAAFAVAALVLLTAAYGSLQYLHLSQELSAALAFSISLPLAVVTWWLGQRSRGPAGGTGTPEFVPQEIEINPAASFADLTSLGIKPTPELRQMSQAGKRPPYVQRAIDDRLRGAVRDHPFVLVIGKSCTGKSRATFEALASEFPGRTLIVPPRPASDREALRKIAAPEFRIHTKKSPAILWLDDVDEFTDNGALNQDTLAALLGKRSPSIQLVATIRDDQYTQRTAYRPQSGGKSESALRNSFGDAAQVFPHAEHVVFKAPWTPAEAEAARQQYPNVQFDPEIGLGAQLVGGPELAERLTLGVDPLGLAVALAAIDARRAGLLRPLTRGELEKLWSIYLPPRPEAPATGEFKQGLDWACAPTAGGVSALTKTADGYVAVDYALALRTGERPDGPVEPKIRPVLWDALIQLVNPAEAYGIGAAAYASRALDQAERALEKSATANEAPIAALSQWVLGNLRLEMSRPGDAISAYDLAIARCGANPPPELRAVMAASLVNKAVALEATNRAGAIAALTEVVTRFGDASETELRTLVAHALVNTAFMLGATDRAEAIRVDDEVVARFGEAPEPELQVLVAKALFNKVLSVHSSDSGVETSSYDDVIDRYGAATDPSILTIVAKAMVNKSANLDLTDPTAAIAGFEGVITRFDQTVEPALQGQVARAMVGKGIALNPTDPPAAIMQFDRVIARFSDVGEPEFKAPYANAIVRKGIALGPTDLPGAIALLDEAVSRFGDDDEPEIRSEVAMALLAAGRLFAERDPAGALAKFAEVDRRFGQAAELTIRNLVAQALVNAGVVLAEVDQEDAAIAKFGEVVARFGDAEEPELREMVALAHEALEDDPA